MNGVLALYDRLPRWLTVLWWVGVSAVVSAAINDVQTGVIAVNPVYVPFVNVALVAAKDFANSQQNKVGGGNP